MTDAQMEYYNARIEANRGKRWISDPDGPYDVVSSHPIIYQTSGYRTLVDIFGDLARRNAPFDHLLGYLSHVENEVLTRLKLPVDSLHADILYAVLRTGNRDHASYHYISIPARTDEVWTTLYHAAYGGLGMLKHYWKNLIGGNRQARATFLDLRTTEQILVMFLQHSWEFPAATVDWFIQSLFRRYGNRGPRMHEDLHLPAIVKHCTTTAQCRLALRLATVEFGIRGGLPLRPPTLVSTLIELLARTEDNTAWDLLDKHGACETVHAGSSALQACPDAQHLVPSVPCLAIPVHAVALGRWVCNDA